MSTLKVITSIHPSGSVSNLVNDASGNVTVGGTAVMASSFLRNRFINGAMEIWQRNTTFSTPSSGAYTADRMFVGWAGAAPTTVARVTGPSGFRYALRVTGAASNTTTVIGQKIESANIADLASKTVTISVVLLASSAQTFTWSAFYANAVDDFSAVTQISTGTWSVTTSATTYTANISLPSQAANGVQVQIYPNAAGAFTSGTFDMTGFQLEQGSVATSFERRLIGQELALCQRYFQVPISGSTDFQQIASRSATTASEITLALPVSMRSTPTAVLGSSPYGRVVAYDSAFSASTANVTSFAVTNPSSTSNINILMTNGSVTAAAGLYGFSFDTTGFSTQIGLSSEL